MSKDPNVVTSAQEEEEIAKGNWWIPYLISKSSLTFFYLFRIKMCAKF